MKYLYVIIYLLVYDLSPVKPNTPPLYHCLCKVETPAERQH